MPDWRAILAQRLRRWNVPEARGQEILRELSEHGEDQFTELCGSMPPAEASKRVAQMVSNPEKLASAIGRAEQEGEMNQRTRKLWIPGFSVLLVTSVLLRLLYEAGPWSEVFWFDLAGGARFGLVLYPWWLVSLPACGALGAFLARRAGADVRVRVVASVFPAVTMAVLFSALYPVVAILDPGVPPLMKLQGVALYMVQWALIPGAALLLGALPFLRGTSGAETAHA